MQTRPNRWATDIWSLGLTKRMGQVVKPLDVVLERCYLKRFVFTKTTTFVVPQAFQISSWWSTGFTIKPIAINFEMKVWSSQLWWSHLHFICMSAVHIIFICLIPFTGRMNSTNWPAPNVYVFIAQLVEHCSANAEAMGLNPVEAPKTFFGLNCGCLNCNHNRDDHTFIPFVCPQFT